MSNVIKNYDPFNIFSEVVFFDIETSGLDKELVNDEILTKPEIVEIGAIKISTRVIDGKLVKTIEEFNETIKNTNTVPAYTFELCQGLTEDDLDNSRDLRYVLYDFREFVGNMTCICHNGKFEKAFMDYYYEKEFGLKFNNTILDSLEFASILEPWHESYSLNVLMQKVLINPRKEKHRGFEDTVDTIKVVNALIYRYAQNKLKPNNKIELESEFNNLDDWEWTEVLERFQLVGEKPDYINEEIIINESNNYKFSDNTCFNSDVFREEELWRSFYSPGYKVREEQIQVYDYIYKALNEEKTGVQEAPTGIGKSVAYVVAATNFIKNTGNKVYISTKTKNLMSSLIKHEIPKIISTLGAENIKYHFIKGKNNYLCKEQLETIDFVGKSLDDRLLFTYLIRYYKFGKVLVGDNDLNYWIVMRYSKDNSDNGDDVRRKVASVCCDSESCNMKECNKAAECLFMNEYKMAVESDIVVINHSLLTKWPYDDMKIQYLICDEGHELIDEAENSSIKEINLNDLKWNIKKLMDENNNMHKMLFNNLSISDEKKNDYKKEIKETGNLIISEANKVVNIFMKQNWKSDSKYDVVKEVDSNDIKTLETLNYSLKNFVGILVNIKEDKVKENSKVNKKVDQIKFIQIYLKEIIANEKMKLYRLEVNKDKNYVALKIYTPRELDNVKQVQLYYSKSLKDIKGVAFTSGTLRVDNNEINGEFDYFNKAIGIDEVEDSKRLEEHFIEPIFDFNKRLIIGVPTDEIKYKPKDLKNFIQGFSKFILDIVLNVPSNTLVLFNSKDRLEKVKRFVEGKLSVQGITVLTSTKELEKLEVEGRKYVFFGSRGCYQGVNLPGDRLNCVILEKLPTSSMDSVEVKLEKIINKNIDDHEAFGRANRSKVALTLEQIKGRVLRTPYDFGYLYVYNGFQQAINEKGYEYDRYQDGSYYESIISDNNVIKASTKGLINKIDDDFKEWITINIRKVLKEENNKIYISAKDFCNNIGSKFRAIEKALNNELRAKQLSSTVQVVEYKDLGKIAYITVDMKGKKIYIRDEIILKYISQIKSSLESNIFNTLEMNHVDNYDDRLQKFLSTNTPKTMEKFFYSIGITKKTDMNDNFDIICEFIERVEELNQTNRIVLNEIVKLSTIRSGQLNQNIKILEVELKKLMKTLKYDIEQIKPILNELERKTMCYIDNSDYTNTITLTGIIGYENLFYDLKEYCKSINKNTEKLLVDLHFNLLD